jgi:hypothetical protein
MKPTWCTPYSLRAFQPYQEQGKRPLVWEVSTWQSIKTNKLPSRLTIRLAHCSEFVFSHLIPRPGFEKQFNKENSIAHHPPPPAKSSPSLSLVDENFDCLRKLEQHGDGGGAGSQGRLLRMRGDARPLRQWLPPSYSVRQVRQDDGRDCCAMLRLWSPCHSSYSSSVSIPLSSLALFVCLFLSFFLLPSLAQHMFCFQQT